MKITSAEFAASATKHEQFPKDGLPEVALVGKSNVGKSSLINAFVNRRGLAKTSSTPGKTQTINFYRINDCFYLVDLPGFGFAKTPREVKKSWGEMIGSYLEQRKELAGILVILDCRREAGEPEKKVYDWLSGFDVPIGTVVTKSDKLSANKLASAISKLKKALPEKHPIRFSALSGDGKVELGRKIGSFLKQD